MLTKINPNSKVNINSQQSGALHCSVTLSGPIKFPQLMTRNNGWLSLKQTLVFVSIPEPQRALHGPEAQGPKATKNVKSQWIN